MNSEAIQEFLVKLGFTVDENSLSKFMGGLDSSAIRIAGFGAAMAAVALEVVHSVQEIAQENVQLGLLATQLKSSADAVDDFIDTASMLGISSEVSSGSLKSLSGNIADAAMGIGRAKLIFEKMGIAVKDSNGQTRGTIEVLEDLKTKMQGMDKAGQIRVMERLGLDPKMLVMFNDAFGNTAYIGKELGKIDIAAGFNLDKAIQESQNFNKSWKGLSVEINLFKMLFEKMHEAIAVRMMPEIAKGIDNVSKTVASARLLIMDNAVKIEDALTPILMTIVKIGSSFAQLTGRAFQLIGDLIKPVIALLLDVNDYTDGWLFKIGALIVAWKAFNLSFLMSPLGLLIALGVAVALLVDDFYGFTEGKKSLIDWGSTTGTVLMSAAALIGGVGIALMATKSIMTAYSVATKIASAATLLFNLAFRATPFGLFITGVAALIGAGYLLIHNWDKVKKWFNEFFGWFEKKGQQIANIASKISSGFGKSMGTLEHKIFGTSGDTKANAIGSHSHIIGNKIIGAGNSNSKTSNVVNQTTTVHVNGSQTPQATAQAVADQQTHVNAQVTRNMTARAR